MIAANGLLNIASPQMSNTNTTLATLAGGFVPMLLKNVLSSKGARLSLKTVSFKGQMDEIIGAYTQYWPLTDFVVQQYVPEEDEEGAEETSDGKTEAENLGKSENGKKKNLTGKIHEEKDENQNKNNEKNKFGESIKSNKDKFKLDDSNKNGMISPGATLISMKSVEDDDAVDLFIDLGVGEAEVWSLHESLESVRSESIMPGYFDPNKVIDDDDGDETHPSIYRVDDKPPKYVMEVPVTHHKQPPL